MGIFKGVQKERDGDVYRGMQGFNSALPLFLFAGWVGCELLLLLTIRRLHAAPKNLAFKTCLQQRLGVNETKS